MTHSSYMRALLGRDGRNQYPGFSTNPIDAFRHLAHDLQTFSTAFLTGTDEEFAQLARVAALEEHYTGFHGLS